MHPKPNINISREMVEIPFSVRCISCMCFHCINVYALAFLLRLFRSFQEYKYRKCTRVNWTLKERRGNRRKMQNYYAFARETVWMSCSVYMFVVGCRISSSSFSSCTLSVVILCLLHECCLAQFIAHCASKSNSENNLMKTGDQRFTKSSERCTKKNEFTPRLCYFSQYTWLDRCMIITFIHSLSLYEVYFLYFFVLRLLFFTSTYKLRRCA